MKVLLEKTRDYTADEYLRMERYSLERSADGKEKYDWSKKFVDYRTLPSFKEYVLIRQDTPHVLSFFREAPDLWRESEVRGLDQEVLFKSIDVRLALSLIYRKVKFDADR